MNRSMDNIKKEDASATHQLQVGSCECSVCEADGKALKSFLGGIDRDLESYLDEAERRGDLKRQEIHLRGALEKVPPPILHLRKGNGFRPFWMIPAVASAVLLLIFFGAIRPAKQGPSLGRGGQALVPQPSGGENRSGGVSLSLGGSEIKDRTSRTPAPVRKEVANLPAQTGQDSLVSVSLGPVELSRHFERAQNLLRSVRNANLDDDPSVELVYDKDNARKLLVPNRMFRQFAEANGDQQISEVLDNLENLLVDVANLSEHPAAEEVRNLQERIRRTEMVATLSLIGNSMALRGAIAE